MRPARLLYISKVLQFLVLISMENPQTRANGDAMRILLCAIAIAISATPAFGQDDFDSGTTLTVADLDALFGGGRGGNRGGNSLQNLITNPDATLVQIKETLRNKKIPLDKNQEKSLK